MDTINLDIFKLVDTTFIDTVKMTLNCADSNAHIINKNDFIGIPMEIAKFLVPSLLTLFLFFIGQIFSWYKSKSERKNELKSIKDSVEIWIDMTKSTILLQIQTNRKFINLLRKTDEITAQPIGFNNILMDKLNDYKFNQYVETFVLNCSEKQDTKVKCLFNLIDGIDYFRDYEMELRNIYKIFQDNTIELAKEWYNAYIKLDELKKNYISIFKGNPTHTSVEFYKKYFYLFNSWVISNKNKKSLNEINSSLIIPLFKIAQESILVSLDDQMAIDALDILGELMIINEKWNINRQGTIDLFWSNTYDAIYVYKGLEKTVQKTKSMKLKRKYNIK